MTECNHRRAVRITYWAVRVMAIVFVLSCMMSFVLAVVTLVDVTHAGTPTPDATHAVQITLPHGRTFYGTARQKCIYSGAVIAFIASGILAVGSSIAVRRFQEDH